MTNPIALPSSSDLVDGNRKMTLDWQNYFVYSVSTPLSQTPTQLYNKTLTAQSASITAAPFPVGALSAGLYELSYFVSITTPASVSSSMTVSFDFTCDGVPRTVTADAITANLATTVQGSTIPIRSDASTPITYSLAYVSVGTALVYTLSVGLKRV